MPMSPMPSLPASSAGSKPAPVVLDQRGHEPLALGDCDADLVVAPRVLDDVRQRLLDDAVERGLYLPWQSLRFEVVRERHVDPGLLCEGLGQPLERRDEPEVVERSRP